MLNPPNRRGTDPYARWCGRGDIARCPPIPISFHRPAATTAMTELGHLAGSATAHQRFERLLQTCAPARWTVTDIPWEVVPRAPVQG